MAILLSMFLGIDSRILEARDVFDPVLDIDTRLFLDPHLLKHCETPEFVGAYEHLKEHFGNIARLLLASDVEKDIFWKRADRLMNWPEVKGLCIGFSKESTDGSGIGPELREQLLRTAKQILSKGVEDHEIFELVGMFQERFGPDRISDMTANVIRHELNLFTTRIFEEIETESTVELPRSDEGLPLNPVNGAPLLLVPRSLLRDIPVALDWSSRDLVAEQNEELRETINRIAGESWKQVVQAFTKEQLKGFALNNPELIRNAVEIYRAKPVQKYDFNEDRSGEASWLPTAQVAVRENPLQLVLQDNPTIDQVFDLIRTICVKFKSLIEDNGLSRLLYDSDGHPKHESASQLLFYGVAESYCHANKLMIARESNGGRGPVDFKFGTNMQNSVLVEIKKSTNTSGLKKGIESQLPIYMNAEGSRRAIYLVIDVGYTKAAISNLNEINSAINGTAISIIHISAALQASASNYQTRPSEPASRSA
ncbi:hypothetical protein [Luteimonas panaciterrae]|uniref:hypothetical protein n=1 Tax=Luteimonas panaciterrae TaxID=363885 RepID=UPI001CFAF901|nr:hypothetical protein [Luteimonas panaciterrae]